MISAVCLASALLLTAAPRIAPERLAAARARWTEACERMHVPGLAVAAVADGKVVFIECLGVRRAGTKLPVDPDSRFYIASVTKTFVATAAKVLEEDGTLKLADPVRHLLPKFALADAKAAESITLEDLLCHRPGLNSEAIVFRDAYTGQIDDPTYFALLSEVTPTARVEYTNVHFTLAGRALAAAANSSWQSVLENRLFAPLKMTRTTALASVLWGDENCCEPHVGVKGGNVIVPHKSDRTMHSAGGLGTTPHDAARWLLFQLGDGTLDGVRVLSAEGVADLHRRRTTLEQPETPAPELKLDGFGLAWNLATYRGESACMHGGGYTGASCMFAFLPERNVGVAVLLNRDSSSATALALMDSLDLLLGRDLDPNTIVKLRENAAGVDWPAAPAPAENPATKTGALSLAPERYVGRYSNETWGEIEIRLDGGRLRLVLGDWDCELHSSGADSFQARQSIANAFPGSFEVDADAATVDGIELRVMDDRRFFERNETR